MGEPTIPEAVVEAAAKALHEIDCQAPKPCGWLVQNDMPSITQGHYDLFRRRARAALAAAEPLMCMATRQANGEMAVVFAEQLDTITELRAENARLRQAGFAQAAEKATLREIRDMATATVSGTNGPTTEEYATLRALVNGG